MIADALRTIKKPIKCTRVLSSGALVVWERMGQDIWVPTSEATRFWIYLLDYQRDR